MSKFKIIGTGSRKILKGIYQVSGSKNESLPAMAMSFLFSDVYTIKNVPQIEDMKRMLELLDIMGFDVSIKGSVFKLQSKKLTSAIDKKIGALMRSSIILTGPILARMGEVSFPYPGGCAIGERPIDLFLNSYKEMGAKISERRGVIKVKARKLKGIKIYLPVVSVTVTESVMMAAALAHGETIIKNAAMEPEVVGIGNYLKSVGVKIEGIGSPVIKIIGTGGKPLKTKGEAFEVIPDRIEAGSVLIMGALSAKDLLIKNVIPEHIESLIFTLEKSGANLKIGKNQIRVLKSKRVLKPVKIKTHEFPGLATDLQQQMGTYATQCNGESNILETIYESRFGYVDDLKKMKAKIDVWNNFQISVKGKTLLRGRKNLFAPDLRGGFALIMAAILAKGESTIQNVYVIKRGYANIIKKLQNIGVKIEEV